MTKQITCFNMTWFFRTHPSKKKCITFLQCWANVEDVRPTLYKCYTNVLRLLGCLTDTDHIVTWFIRSLGSLRPDSLDHVSHCDLIQQITCLIVTIFIRSRVSLWPYSSDHVSHCDLINQITCPTVTWFIKSRVSLWPDSLDHVSHCNMIH